MINLELYYAAVEAIDALFSDQSVDLEKALENMENLKREIEEKINTLEFDIDNQEG